MKLNTAVLLAGLALLPFNAAAFGPTGHRVVGQICQDNLSAKAEASIKAIMGQEKLAWAATWPDEKRGTNKHQSFWRDSTQWHFVNVPKGESYASMTKNPKGDLIVALQAFSNVLKDVPLEDGPIKTSLTAHFGDLTTAENQQKLKQFAVRFIIHLVGDLHQPLHAGYKSDLGGNKIDVKWFGQYENLHRVWDSLLVDGQKFSFSELADKLGTISVEDKNTIQASSVNDWLDESVKLRDVAYNVDSYDEQSSITLLYNNANIINGQMQKAGLRAAKLFNLLFK